MKELLSRLSKYFKPFKYDNDMMTYFKAEYKNDPESAYCYWMTTKNHNYFN